jgi:mannose-6-phosphate isomerase-like protein (cupin superfamily)
VRITSREDIKEPIRNATGEVVYELIGTAAERGGAEKHSLAVVTIPPGKSSAEHYHLVSEETYYLLRGAARLVVDGQALVLLPGQACLIQPGERHQIHSVGDEDLEFLAICAPAWVADDSVFV